MSSSVGLEDVIELSTSVAGKVKMTIAEAVELWRAVRECRNTVLEIGRTDGIATAVCTAATSKRICSYGLSTEVLPEVAAFFHRHRLGYQVELRTSEPQSSMDDSVSCLVITLQESTTLVGLILDYWRHLRLIGQTTPLVCLLTSSLSREAKRNWDHVLKSLISDGCAQPIARVGELDVLRKLGEISQGLYLRHAAKQRVEGTDPALSERLFKSLLETYPDSVEGMHEYGRFLLEKDRLTEAEDYFRQAVAKKKSHHYLNNLAICLLRQGNAEAALPHILECLDIEPNYVHGWNTLGWAYEECDRLSEAEAALRKAVTVDKEYTHAQYNLGRTLLKLGDLKNGWRQYEWRWKQPNFPSWKREYPFPLWDGSSLKGKRILLWSEQGIGDQIVFSSMIRDVMDAGATGVIECSAKLVSIFQRSFPEFEVIEMKREPDDARLKEQFDFHAPVGNLGQYLRDSLGKFPDKTGHLVPDDEHVEVWRKRLNKISDFPKVGIAWRSQNTKGSRSKHYLSMEELEPVLTVPKCTFVCVQYGSVSAEIEQAQKLYGVRIVKLDDLDLFDDIDGIVAMTKCLDFGVASQSSSCLDLMAVNDVKILAFDRGRNEGIHGTDYMPWFPSVSCYRGEIGQPSRHAVERMAEKLENLVTNYRAPSS